jgi:hypothetical protein
LELLDCILIANWNMGISENWIAFLDYYLVFLIIFSLKKIKLKVILIQKLIHKINEIPKTDSQKNILLGVESLLVFSHQYYFFFWPLM